MSGDEGARQRAEGQRLLTGGRDGMSDHGKGCELEKECRGRQRGEAGNGFLG